MQNEQNPDVNSLNIGSEPESSTESVETIPDTERTDVEGTYNPVTEDDRRNQSIEQPPSTVHPEREKDDSEVKQIS